MKVLDLFWAKKMGYRIGLNELKNVKCKENITNISVKAEWKRQKKGMKSNSITKIIIKTAETKAKI